MGARITQKNPRAIRDRVDAIKPVTVKIGIQGSDATKVHDKALVVEIAAIHEFGLGVPRRSWLADWYDQHEKEGLDKLRAGMRKVIAGELSSETVARALGLWGVASIQERISNGINPPLDPATIAAKGSSTPLIDRGVLRSSITFVAETGDMVSGVLP